MDIKICGLKTEEAMRAAITAGASHVGFIFFPKSPRNIDPRTASALAALARGKGVTTVAVTVDADDAQLQEIVRVVQPDMLQLHGSETPERVAEIKARYGLPVMKVFSVSTLSDLVTVDAYRSVADRILFDAKPPAGSDLPGGNGVSFDWTMLADLDPQLDYMLSGGLNAANVGEALATANPPGIDISSGVESAPGIKDSKLIEAFFAAARAGQPA